MNHGLGKDGWPSDATVIKTRDKEIESLRAQLAKLKAENERLVAELEKADAYTERKDLERDELKAEIERLVAANAYHVTNAQAVYAEASELKRQNAALLEEDSEVHRLKDATIVKQGDEIAALLVAIEAKDAALEDRVFNRHGWDKHGDVAAIQAISPSAELLEARDRKRDAKLLRLADEQVDTDDYPMDIWRLADLRESGEWLPELGD